MLCKRSVSDVTSDETIVTQGFPCSQHVSIKPVLCIISVTSTEHLWPQSVGRLPPWPPAVALEHPQRSGLSTKPFIEHRDTQYPSHVAGISVDTGSGLL